MKDNRKLGLGGAPTRNTTLPTEAAERKKYPVASGFLDYFPDAVAAVANLSYRGNEQHNPGQPLHWARGKSADEADTMMRHFLQRGTLDNDGVPHTVKMAWRAMAILQKEIEAQQLQETLKLNTDFDKQTQMQAGTLVSVAGDPKTYSLGASPQTHPKCRVGGLNCNEARRCVHRGDDRCSFSS